MLVRTPLFEIWLSRGTGMVRGPRFRWIVDAQRYVHEHRDEASIAVRSPDGSWEFIVPRSRHYSSREIRTRRSA